MLKTPAGKAFALTRDRRIYIVWIALIWVGMIAGFLPDISRYLAEKPQAPPLILHLHGFIYFLWLVVATVQIALVEVRMPALHKQLGWWLVGLSVAIVPVGFVAAMVDMVREGRVSLAPYEPQFLGLEFQELLVFPILLWLAVRMRGDLAAHKRLMILLAVSILDPGTSRAFSFFSPIHPAGPFGFWLNYFWGNAAMVLAMMGWDLWRHGRIHPALITGGALLGAGEAVAVVLQFSPWWHDVAARLVIAWGWAG
jgi:hypothetical protein